MKCKCNECGIEYENNRDYQTSICDECFKKLNENKLQPLRDEIHRLQKEIEYQRDLLAQPCEDCEMLKKSRQGAAKFSY